MLKSWSRRWKRAAKKIARARKSAVESGDWDVVMLRHSAAHPGAEDEILPLARWARDTGVELRFIEFMPLDATGHWMHDKVVSQDEIVERINAELPLELLPARGAAPADRWRYLDGGGTVGVVPTVTKPFCDDCDRVRLTADGQFRTCLFATSEFDLRAMLRAELRNAMCDVTSFTRSPLM